MTSVPLQPVLQPNPTLDFVRICKNANRSNKATAESMVSKFIWIALASTLVCMTCALFVPNDCSRRTTPVAVMAASVFALIAAYTALGCLAFNPARITVVEYKCEHSADQQC